MASSKKQASQISTLELLLGISPAANRWLKLFTSVPSSSSAGTEVADSGYARQPITSWAAITSGGGLSQTSNAAAMDFGAAVDGAVTVVAFAISDAVSGGNDIYWGTMTNFTTPIGVGIHINAGACVVTET